MTKHGGVYELPCLVNGVKMDFIFDTGASSVCLSTTEANFLYKNGYLDDTDFIGESYSMIADGSIVENMEIMLKSIVIEGVEINNVKATIVKSIDAPLLLGQTALQKFGRIEFSGDSLFISVKGGDNQRVETQSSSNNQLSSGTSLNPRIAHFGGKKATLVETNLLNAIEANNNDMTELAIQYCKEAISANAKDWRSYAFLGKYYDEDDNYIEEAIEQYKIYLDLNKGKESFRIGTVTISWLDIAESLALDYAKRRLPNPSGSPKYGSQAISLAQEILLQDPNNVRAMEAMCVAYTLGKQYEKAESWANRLKSISESKGLFRLAYLYSLQGRTSEAINAYVKYLEFNPDNSSAMGNLALLYARSFKDDEKFYDGRYYPPSTNKEYYWETVRLHMKAARMGAKNSQEWLKKRNLEW